MLANDAKISRSTKNARLHFIATSATIKQTFTLILDPNNYSLSRLFDKDNYIILLS